MNTIIIGDREIAQKKKKEMKYSFCLDPWVQTNTVVLNPPPFLKSYNESPYVLSC